MRTKSSKRSLWRYALVAAALCGLAGCGGEKPESEKDFIQSIRESAGADDSAVGTLPGVGESMQKVARIRVETTEFDAGLIANDELHHTKLKIYNDGHTPLTLTKVDTTCACTQGFIEPERATVPPGGESWIDVVIDPYRIPKFHSHKTLSIVSTDPNQGVVQVGVSADVDPEFEVDTDEIDVGELKKGEVVEKRVRFRQLQEAPIALSGLVPATGGANGALVPGVSGEVVAIPETEWRSPGHPEYDLVLTIGPDLPAGSLERALVLKLDTPRMKMFRIGILGTVAAPYTVTPAYPNRTLLKPDPRSGASIAHVSFEANSPVTLSDMTSENTNLVLSVNSGSTPNEAALAIALTGAPLTENLDTVVRVKVHVDGQAYDELVAVRAAAAAGALPEAAGDHSPGDGHNH